MTSGEILRKKLKIENIPVVKIRRCITASSLPIYQIVYNSRYVNFPLPAFRLNHDIRMPRVLASGKLYYTPWIDLDKFLGNIVTKIFLVTDIAGVYGKRDSYSESIEKQLESTLTFGSLKVLNEFITLSALLDKEADLTSDLTQKYKDIRKDIQKTANINTKLITTEIIDNKDVMFSFLTEATEMYGKDHKFIEIDPITKEKKPNPSKTYTIQFKFLDVLGENGWINTFDTSKEKLTTKDIKDLINVSNVQLWSSDPSFQFQGFAYWNTVLDSAIYPETRAPKVWNKKHGDGTHFLTKHLSQLIDQMPFFFNQMASSLTKLLKKEGIINAKFSS